MPNSKWNYLNHMRTISRNHFHSKLAGSLVTLFVKYFHYLREMQLYVAHSGSIGDGERAYESKTSHNWFYIESRKHNLMYSSTNYSQSNYISVTFLHLILEALFNNIKSMESSNALCTLGGCTVITAFLSLSRVFLLPQFCWFQFDQRRRFFYFNTARRR